MATLNIDNINKVIELIRDEEVAKFDMKSFRKYTEYHPCKTAGCIAGFAAIAAGHDINKIHENSISKVARDFIGIDWETGHDLFNGYSSDNRFMVPLKSFRKQDAIKVLEHLRDTGKVDVSMIPGAIARGTIPA